MAEPRTFIEFDTLAEAMQHRRRTGCGGWIYDVEGPDKRAVIFPQSFTPSQVMAHRIVRGCWGQFYA